MRRISTTSSLIESCKSQECCNMLYFTCYIQFFDECAILIKIQLLIFYFTKVWYIILILTQRNMTQAIFHVRYETNKSQNSCKKMSSIFLTNDYFLALFWLTVKFNCKLVCIFCLQKYALSSNSIYYKMQIAFKDLHNNLYCSNYRNIYLYICKVRKCNYL